MNDGNQDVKASKEKSPLALLRERRGGMSNELKEYFLQQQNPGCHFSTDAIAALQSHNWPGNIRELRNAVTKAAVLTRSEVIRSSDLLLAPGPRPKLNDPVPISAAPPNGSNGANLDRLEKTAILETLARTNGHQQRAAEILGISRRTLSRKLKLYGMEAARQSCAS